jgi:DNA-binding transcriptional regulator YiaG
MSIYESPIDVVLPIDLSNFVKQYLKPHQCSEELKIKQLKKYGKISMDRFAECLNLVKQDEPFIEKDWKKVVTDWTDFFLL